MNIRNIDKTKVKRNKLKVFEAFAGIGAQRKALKNIKSQFKIVGMAEWYIPAIISYQAIHNKFDLKKVDNKISLEKMIEYLETKTLSNDSKKPITKGYWKKLPEKKIKIVYSAVKASEKEGNIFNIKDLHTKKLKNINLLTYSFPCQDLSQQGKQKGMTQETNTRSSLIWEIGKTLDKIAKKDLPQYLLMENVLALNYKKNSQALNQWINKLKSLGYKNDKQVLNANDFGAPQARRRLFMLSSLQTKVLLPIKKNKPKKIKHILDKNPKITDFMHNLNKFKLSNFKLTKKYNIKKAQLIGYSTFNSETFVYDPEYTGPTLTASGANSRIKIFYQNKIRKLNAREAFKYMGFVEKDFNKINNLNIFNETKMIFLCGNSIVIKVMEAIMKNIESDYINK